MINFLIIFLSICKRLKLFLVQTREPDNTLFFKTGRIQISSDYIAIFSVFNFWFISSKSKMWIW